MLVKNACWWKTCMLAKNLHQHSPPKYHDVGENNVGEIVCWRKKICSFKIICMLVNYVGENFSVCWWKVFSLVKYVCWWEVYVGEIFYQHAAFTHTFTQILCWWKPSKPNLWSFIKIGWWSIRSWKFKYKYIMIVQSVRYCLSIRSWLKVYCPSYAVLAESIRSFARNFDFSCKVRRKVYDLWVINNTIVRE